MGWDGGPFRFGSYGKPSGECLGKYINLDIVTLERWMDHRQGNKWKVTRTNDFHGISLLGGLCIFFIGKHLLKT